ncbi:MAG: bifunctional DNA primase/polymerase [Pyrinomonadaceae bacterium]|nr:bifunctional DNA primase/polymerase [Pyrinomonadaceae bacterium]
MRVQLRKLGIEAEALYGWLPDWCTLSERDIAAQTGITKYDVRHAKRVLSGAGLIQIHDLPNKNYRNPAHGIAKVKSQHIAPISIASAVGGAGAATLHGLGVWLIAERLDLVDLYLRSGWNIVPVRPGEKQPVMSRKHWQSKWPSPESKLDFFWENRKMDVGMWVCNLTIFDFDSRQALRTWGADKYVTLTCGTRRGAHLYFNQSVVTTTAGQIAPDVDTRCAGSFVVLPPSTGKEWIMVAEPVDVPEELIDAYYKRTVTKRQSSAGETGLDFRRLPEIIKYRTRNDTLFRYGRSLRARGWKFEALATELRQVNSELCTPPLTYSETTNLIHHIWTYPDAEEGWTRSWRHIQPDSVTPATT